MKRWLVVALLAACTGAQDDWRSVGTSDLGLKVGQNATVMTRNLYLGADLGPAMGASSLDEFVSATGAVVRSVTATNFPVRAKGVAAEILAVQPDLVGLQEVALWRTGAPSLAPLLGAPPSASTVRVDYLALLLAELGGQYTPIAIQQEFDFEAPADENLVAGDGPAPIFNAELNARLTMRDVILARVDAGIRYGNVQAGHYAALLPVPILGHTLQVTRGWTSADVRVRGTTAFRFVTTHFEAFDPRALHPSIRAYQAMQLGALPSELPVVLVGDLNSDDDTVHPDDQQAYRALLAAGYTERSTGDPLSCCINSDDLTTGTVADFDHQVDHIMTNSDAITLVSSGVTGRTMNNGWWDSDHAGVWSTLHIR